MAPKGYAHLRECHLVTCNCCPCYITTIRGPPGVWVHPVLSVAYMVR